MPFTKLTEVPIKDSMTGNERIIINDNGVTRQTNIPNYVKTIGGVIPDQNGNVEIELGESWPSDLPKPSEGGYGYSEVGGNRVFAEASDVNEDTGEVFRWRFYKISDEVYEPDNLVGTSWTNRYYDQNEGSFIEDDTTVCYGSSIFDEEHQAAMDDQYYILTTASAGTLTFNGCSVTIVAPEPGLYFALYDDTEYAPDYVSRLGGDDEQIPEFVWDGNKSYPDLTHSIDPKYLPDGGFGWSTQKVVHPQKTINIVNSNNSGWLSDDYSFFRDHPNCNVTILVNDEIYGSTISDYYGYISLNDLTVSLDDEYREYLVSMGDGNVGDYKIDFIIETVIEDIHKIDNKFIPNLPIDNCSPGDIIIIGSIGEDGRPNSYYAGAYPSVYTKMEKNNPTGTGSFSMNRKAQTTIGTNSFTQGKDNTASGECSHAEGHFSQAEGECSHAEGYQGNAKGDYSHAEGDRCHAIEHGSHAEGGYSRAGGTEDPTTSGYIPNLKFDSSDSGCYSHTEGFATWARGTCAHTEGYKTVARDDCGHAEGKNTIANGVASHVEGEGTVAFGNASHVEGKYNLLKSSGSGYAHVIGNGTSTNKRHNCFMVDWNGAIYVQAADDDTKMMKLTVKSDGTITAEQVNI